MVRNDRTIAQTDVWIGDEADAKFAEMVEKVTVELHPSFSNPHVELTSVPYEHTRIGWGVFTSN